MKKSNLRRLIRESIRELMKEQSVNVWGYPQYQCTITDWPQGGAYPNGWIYTFTNTVNNHNNKCNFLNKKEAQFSSLLAGGAGPVQMNIWGCKLNQIMALKSHKNC